MIARRILKPEVSFINLIDVTLVLLLIFMITAPAIQDMVNVELPSGKASTANISEGVVITVDKDGIVYIEKEKIKSEEFERRFNDIWKKRSGEPVYIRGDESVLYGHVMNVLDIVKRVGGENVGLVVEERRTKSRK